MPRSPTALLFLGGIAVSAATNLATGFTTMPSLLQVFAMLLFFVSGLLLLRAAGFADKAQKDAELRAGKDVSLRDSEFDDVFRRNGGRRSALLALAALPVAILLLVEAQWISQ